MTKRLEELEERKRSLQAEVNAFIIQQNYRGTTKRVLLPQIEQVKQTLHAWAILGCLQPSRLDLCMGD